MVSTGAYHVSIVLRMIKSTCVVISLVAVFVYILINIIGRIDAIVGYTVHSYALWVTTTTYADLCSY